MKRMFIVILAMCLLLTGCGVSNGADKPGEAGTSAEGQPTAEPVEESSLLDVREAFDDAGVLWYIPNSQIEAQGYPTLRSFADNLLLIDTNYIGDGNSELTLMLLNQTSGEPLQSCSVISGGSTEIQLLDGSIALCDGNAGTVILLDAELHETARYELTPDAGQWLLGYDMDTLYKCSFSDGIRAVSLSTGKEQTIFDAVEMSICNVTDAGVCFTGMDRKTQKYGAFFLDLVSGTLTEPPFHGDFFNICRSGELWLAGIYGDGNRFVFGTGTDARTVTAQDGTFSLIDPFGYLLFTGYDGELSLYDSNGAFISAYSLSGLYVQSIVWYEAHNGFLMLANDGSRSRLLFWDISAGTNGEALQTQPYDDSSAVPGGTSADASLYERAQALSDRFDVEIYIADQCETEYTYFSCYQVSDYEFVSSGLDVLETALSVFPEGFFRQLTYGHIDTVQFQLVGGLTATNGFGGGSSYDGFTEANGNVCRIVLDIYSIGTNTVWHELSHAIDKRLAWDAMYRDDALFSEEGWRAKNPDDFAYSEEYGSMRNDIQAEWYSYFVDNYAMINTTEDRARIFEHAIDNSGTMFQNAGLKAKLQYYCDCIRDCFDTAQWPETTAWEVPLR